MEAAAVILLCMMNHPTFTFESFSRCCYPEQFTGEIRVKSLAHGHIDRFFT